MNMKWYLKISLSKSGQKFCLYLLPLPTVTNHQSASPSQLKWFIVGVHRVFAASSEMRNPSLSINLGAFLIPIHDFLGF